MSNNEPVAKRVPLSALAVVNPSKSASTLMPDTEVSFIPMSDVSESGEWITRQVRLQRDVSSGFTPFADGDVLFAKITPCMENGKGCHAVGLINGMGYGSTEFHVLRPREQTDGRFIFYWSQAASTRNKAETFMIGSAGQQRVQPEFFDHYYVPALPLPEQRRIAEILGTLDEAIRKTEQVIAKAQQMKQGLLHDLLTRGIDENGELRDPERHPGQFKDSVLGWIPSGWTISSVSDLTSFITDYRGSTPPYTSEGVAVLSAENVGGGKVKSITKYVSHETYRQTSTRGFPEPGDTLFTTEAPVAEIARLPDDQPYRLTRRIIALRPVTRISKGYLFWNMYRLSLVGAWDSMMQGSTVPRILKPDILSQPLAEASRAEQEDIVKILDLHESRIEGEVLYLAKLRALKHGLMDDLLTGRVRVTVPEETAS